MHLPTNIYTSNHSGIHMKKIHILNDNKCVISYKGHWIPGCFENEETANKAFEFTEEQIISLQHEKNKTTCFITMKDLESI